MLIPAPLVPGQHIGLIAPSSPVQPDRISKCIEAIKSLDLFPILGKSVLQTLHGYLAGPDDIRAGDINSMFCNPNVDAIFCIRGGYGANRLMKYLDFNQIKNNPKIFMGYSDITAFHLAFHSLCNLVTFHGPMVSSNMIDDLDEYTALSMLQAMQLPKKCCFQNPIDIPFETIIPGLCQGRILGGCLSIVCSSIGTFYQPDFHNAILFLEEINETIPKIDRMMYQLLNAGIFTQISGVILGNFVNCLNLNHLSYTIQDYFYDFFEGYNKPVLTNFQSGHDKPMGTIPLGTLCTLNTYNQTVCFELW